MMEPASSASYAILWPHLQAHFASAWDIADISLPIVLAQVSITQQEKWAAPIDTPGNFLISFSGHPQKAKKLGHRTVSVRAESLECARMMKKVALMVEEVRFKQDLSPKILALSHAQRLSVALTLEEIAAGIRQTLPRSLRSQSLPKSLKRLALFLMQIPWLF
jgi:hypothetical protein